ncbi:hypothetical protein ACMA1D_26355 [Streptomyces sp. 796.1]|uniref:hypothetical protein n=1 Tax=Streptomyces sp. 796.1 TaxID=3163029 RepID=UPI0039C9DCA0
MKHAQNNQPTHPFRRSGAVAFAAVTLLCLAATTGCGGSDDGGKDKKAEKSEQAKPALKQRLDQPRGKDPQELPAPPDTAPFSDQLTHELRKRTLDMAGVDGKTTGQCPKGIESKKGTTVTCSTTFAGQRIDWQVTIGDKALMSLVEYQATPTKGILTREGVAKLLFGNYKGSIEYALCNDIPEVVLVPLNAQTSYACETVFKGKEPTGASTPIRATDSGPRAF